MGVWNAIECWFRQRLVLGIRSSVGTLALPLSKKISNDQELIQSDPISCPQNQKGNNKIHKLTTVYERHSRQTEWTALSQIGGHSAT